MFFIHIQQRIQNECKILFFYSLLNVPIFCLSAFFLKTWEHKPLKILNSEVWLFYIFYCRFFVLEQKTLMNHDRRFSWCTNIWMFIKWRNLKACFSNDFDKHKIWKRKAPNESYHSSFHLISLTLFFTFKISWSTWWWYFGICFSFECKTKFDEWC